MEFHLELLDYIILGAFLLLMAFIGSAFGWLVKDASQYLKGGNTIPWYIAGVSNFMSLFSTFVFVAYAGIAYEHGLVSITLFWSTVVPCLVAGGFLASRWRRAEVSTPVEYLERRFDVSVRQTFSWLGLVMRLLDNSVRLYAAGLFLATVTPVDLVQAIVICGILVTIFTMIGGLWAVVVMDTIQFIVLIFATLVLLPVAWQAAGGVAGISAVAPENLGWFNGPKGESFWILAYYVLITLKYNGNWAFIQRLYCVPDEASAKRVAWLSGALFFLSTPVFLLPAVAARAITPNLENPETAYVAVCALLLPSGMMGLMLASMFSATVSSLNSEFNVMAAVLTKDFYQRLLKPSASDHDCLVFARWSTVAVGLLVTVAGVFVGGLGGAFEANKLFASLFAIPLAIPLLVGLLLKKPTARGALMALIGGASLSLVLHLSGVLSWEASTVTVCIATFVILLAFSKPRDAVTEQRIEDLFQRLNSPLPASSVPTLHPGFKIALGRLLALACVVSGAFFTFTGVVHIGTFVGQLSLASGLACVGLAVFVFFRLSRR